MAWSKERREAHDKVSRGRAGRIIEFGQRVSRSREKTGLTVTQAAKAIGVSPRAWRAWEEGKRYTSIDNAFLVGQLLGITFKELFGHADRRLPRAERISRGLFLLAHKHKLTDAQAARQAGVSMKLWQGWRQEQQPMTLAQAEKVGAIRRSTAVVPWLVK